MRKIITVATVKPLANSSDGKKRYSLYEDRMNHCVYTENPNWALPKVGDKILAMEQDIILKDGTSARGWYFVQPYSNEVVTREVNRDFDHKVAQGKEVQTAALKLKISSLTAAEVSSMLEI